MPNKQFLEEYPLYKKYNTDWTFNHNYPHTFIGLGQLPKPSIHMVCSFCDSEQTFNMDGQYYDSKFEQNQPVHDQIKELRYICSGCNRGLRVFLINFVFSVPDEDGNSIIVLEKVGQIPPWTIKMDSGLENILGDHSILYKRGLINESQGYGIGAHSYFRRIVEEVIDELLNSIYNLVEPSEKEEYQEALDKTKKTRVTQEKIDLVKDLLPPSLKPDNINPLTVIHSALSEGLHDLSDEECLEQAELIRNSLVFLINQIIRTRSSAQSFTDSMKKLLVKKSKKNSYEN